MYHSVCAAKLGLWKQSVNQVAQGGSVEVRLFHFCYSKATLSLSKCARSLSSKVREHNELCASRCACVCAHVAKGIHKMESTEDRKFVAGCCF